MPPKPIDIRAASRKALHRSTANDGQHYVRHPATDEGFKVIPRDLISPDPDQPRKTFDEQALDELAASIKEKGILQTLIVRPDPNVSGRFIITSGERRWRAAGMIGLQELPCIIRNNPNSREIAIIENIQREDLAPLELAEGLQRLKTKNGYTDAQLAKVIGKSRVLVTETLSLNALPETIKAECRTSDKWTKSQLLQVLRAGSPENVQATWKALEGRETTTVRELRQQRKQQKPTPGRPKHYRFDHKPKGKPYQVTVIFTKKTASRAELRNALKDALKHLP